MHSCQGDSAALYHQFGVLLQNVFDTQVDNGFLFSIENVHNLEIVFHMYFGHFV